MIMTSRVPSAARGLAVASLLWLAGCGSDSNLNIDSRAACLGGNGSRVFGVVSLPYGKLAQRTDALERFAALLVAPVDAITGVVSPVGKGVEVQLLQLRPEDLASGSEPGVLARATTNGKGEFCVELRDGTDVDVCRYMLQVGSSADGTRTRAFVYSTSDPVDVDLYSDATVSVILADIAPGELCRFSADEIRDIRQAVLEAPGTVTGASVAEVNAVAASFAAADARVETAVDEAGNRPAPTATDAPGPVSYTHLTLPTNREV